METIIYPDGKIRRKKEKINSYDIILGLMFLIFTFYIFCVLPYDIDYVRKSNIKYECIDCQKSPELGILNDSTIIYN